MEMETEAMLPTLPAQCRTLRQWREFVLIKTQREVAASVGLKQARIQAVECGRVMPRPKSWPRLMNAFQQTDASKPRLTEAEFYRMCVTANREFAANKNKAEELKRPRTETHPLIGAAVAQRRVDFLRVRYAPAPVSETK